MTKEDDTHPDMPRDQWRRMTFSPCCSAKTSHLFEVAVRFPWQRVNANVGLVVDPQRRLGEARASAGQAQRRQPSQRRNTDAGATWSAFSADWQGLRHFAFGPAGSATVDAVTAKGAVKSVDGGIRWTPMTIGLPAAPLFGLLRVDPNDPSRLYAPAGRFPKLRRRGRSAADQRRAGFLSRTAAPTTDGQIAGGRGRRSFGQ